MGETKIGLVLEGGGMRGVYTAGVLDAFLDAGWNLTGRWAFPPAAAMRPVFYRNSAAGLTASTSATLMTGAIAAHVHG